MSIHVVYLAAKLEAANATCLTLSSPVPLQPTVASWQSQLCAGQRRISKMPRISSEVTAAPAGLPGCHPAMQLGLAECRPSSKKCKS